MSEGAHLSGHGHHSHITAQNKEELAALLEYAIHHNASHIDELLQIAGRFRESGDNTAAGKITAAAEEFAKGNSLLGEAAESLE